MVGATDAGARSMQVGSPPLDVARRCLEAPDVRTLAGSLVARRNDCPARADHVNDLRVRNVGARSRRGSGDGWASSRASESCPIGAPLVERLGQQAGVATDGERSLRARARLEQAEADQVFDRLPCLARCQPDPAPAVGGDDLGEEMGLRERDHARVGEEEALEEGRPRARAADQEVAYGRPGRSVLARAGRGGARSACVSCRPPSPMSWSRTRRESRRPQAPHIPQQVDASESQLRS